MRTGFADAHGGPLVRKAPLAAALLAVISFYLWTASDGRPFVVGEPPDNYYNLLTDAWLHRQLHLRVEPRPELFELADPYDARRNERHRLTDASLYHGKYYLYFGAAPAITLFAPWRLLGLGDLPQGLAAAIFAAGGFLFGVLLLRELVAGAGEKPGEPAPANSSWAWAGAVCVLGFANVAPFVLRHPSVYEVAVSAGLFFLAGSAWLTMAASNAGASVRRRLAWGGLFLGLAVGSRPNHAVAVPIVLLLAWPAVRRAAKPVAAALALLAPLAAVLLLLGLHNRARFDSWSEFGVSYALAGARVRFFDLPAVLSALRCQFFVPPALGIDSPFFFPSDRCSGAPSGLFYEAVVGVLWHSPFILALLLAPRLLRGDKASPLQRQRVSILAGLGIASPLLTNTAFPAVTMRYQMDFATFLAVPALAVWCLAHRHANGRARLAIRVAAVLTMGWTCVVMAAIGRTGRGDMPAFGRPAWLAVLEQRRDALCTAVRQALQDRNRVVVRFRAALPERLSADQEALLSSGTVARHDILWLRSSASTGSWRLALAPAEGEVRLSPAFELPPNAFHAFEVELDRAGGEVVVRIDGVLVARMASALEPLDPRTLTLGRGPRGNRAPDILPFSGSLLSQGFLSAAVPGLEALPPISTLPALYTDAGAPPPTRPALGQLWVPAEKEGAYIRGRSGWRWIPRQAVDRVLFWRSLSFARLAEGSIEPIASSGDDHAADTVFVRHLAGGWLAFGCARWNRSWHLGAIGPAQPPADRLRDLRVTLDRPAALVTVELDGSPVLRAQVELLPLARAGLQVGQTPGATPLGPAFRPTLRP